MWDKDESGNGSYFEFEAINSPCWTICWNGLSFADFGRIKLETIQVFQISSKLRKGFKCHHLYPLPPHLFLLPSSSAQSSHIYVRAEWFYILVVPLVLLVLSLKWAMNSDLGEGSQSGLEYYFESKRFMENHVKHMQEPCVFNS